MTAPNPCAYAVSQDTTDWPQGLVAIADVVGPDLTLKLVEKFGGVEKYFIPRLKNSRGYYHPRASILGDVAWQALCKKLGGQKINLPRGCYLKLKKKMIIDLAADRTISHRTIALRAQVTETYVRIVLQGLGAPSEQLDLFGR
jgi:hypothetical protein